jgi:ATP-dependent DNA ligase
VGYYDDGQFRYAGKVGTGYDTETLLELRRRLDAMLTLQRPFAADTGIPRKGVHWVKPRLVAEVAFSEWTSDGKLRQPRFLGLRPDKPPSKVVRESPGVAPRVDRQGLQRTRIKPDQDDGSPRRRWRRS